MCIYMYIYFVCIYIYMVVSKNVNTPTSSRIHSTMVTWGPHFKNPDENIHFIYYICIYRERDVCVYMNI